MHVLSISPELAQRLKEQHVSVQIGGLFRAQDGIRMEAPCGLFGGVSVDNLLTFGAFSYSWSMLTRVSRVGRYCSIATNVAFGAGEHPTDWISTSSAFYARSFLGSGFAEQNGGFDPVDQDVSHPRYRDITIGNDVWIGDRAYIRGGVHIGDGAIIGTDAVVTKDVPSYAVVVGNPGRVVKMRFAEKIIARLLASRWHDYSFTSFQGLPFTKVEEFLDILDAKRADGSIQPYQPRILTFPNDFVVHPL